MDRNSSHGLNNFMQWADKKYSRDDTGTVSSSYTFAKPEVQLPVQIYPNYNRQVNQQELSRWRFRSPYRQARREKGGSRGNKSLDPRFIY